MLAANITTEVATYKMKYKSEYPRCKMIYNIEYCFLNVLDVVSVMDLR